jgi:integrase
MRVWLPALRAARLPSDMRIHDLRHTCAALLIEQGAHPKVIQEQLGHASITTTLDTYGHLFDDHLDQLAEGMDKTFAEAERTRTRTKSGQRCRLDVVTGQQQLL